jgi:hypothetical protein
MCLVCQVAWACRPRVDCLSMSLGQLILILCQTNTSCNQKCFVAICRGLWSLKASASVQNMSLWQSFLKFLAKSGAKDKFKEEMLILKPLVDTALLTSYTNFKKEQVGAQAWWELFKDRCCSHACHGHGIELAKNLARGLLCHWFTPLGGM